MTSQSAPGRRRERVGLAAAILIVVVYSAINLDKTPLWLDEGYTLGAVNRLGDSLRGTYGTMGLYYVVMWAWGLVSTATWWLRLPSVLFAVASLLVLRPIARRIGGSDLVALALPIAALGPMFLWKATEARAYSMETLITCVSWYAVVRATDALSAGDDRAARRWYLALAPLAIGGVLSHGLYVMQLVPMGVVALLGPKPRRAVLWFAPAVIAASGLVLLLRGLGGKSVGINIPGGADVLIASTLAEFFSPEVVPRLILAQVLAVGVFVGMRRVLRTTDRARRAFAATPMAWALLPCIALGIGRWFDPVFNPRYLAPIGPGLAMLLAIPLLAVDRRIQVWARLRSDWRVPRIGLASAAIVAVLVIALASPPIYVDGDWRGVARVIAAETQPGDGIVVATLSIDDLVQYRVPFEAAWREVPHGASPDMISPSRPLGEVRRFDEPLSIDEIAEQAAARPRVWVIGSDEPGWPRSAPVADELVARTDLERVESFFLEGNLELVLLEQP